MAKPFHEISCLVGGQQGEGIESIGEMFSLAANRMGCFVHTNRMFSSRIKGGNSHVKMRISRERIVSSLEYVDIMIAFDQPTLDLNASEMAPGGIVIADKGLELKNDDVENRVQFISLDLKQMAGSAISKNMVGLGFLASLLKMPTEPLEQIIEKQFSSKGTAIVEQNKLAFQSGFHKGSDVEYPPFVWGKTEPDGESPLILSGNEAIALGAVAAGCKFIAGYPITPATEVLEILSNMLPKVGGVAVQAEDELAAINMAIGSGIAGVRSIAPTSGPGLSLMQEAIGLAGMTETPVVIVDLQRGGPSSGMATKHEQSDLFAMLHGSHGEVQRIVMSPTTVEEAFYDMIRAFNYSEIYQCPVIVAADLGLATCKQTMPAINLNKIQIERGHFASNEELLEANADSHPRYAVTEQTLSRRSIPGQPKGMHHITGIEHNDIGYPSEDPANRVKMVNKRRDKFKRFAAVAEEQINWEGADDYEILLIGFGSSYGVIQDARKELENYGHKPAHMQIRVISPFPIDQCKEKLQKAKRIFVVENNSTGQLAQLIKQEIPCHEKLVSVTKYNGLPFTKTELFNKVTEELAYGSHAERL